MRVPAFTTSLPAVPERQDALRRLTEGEVRSRLYGSPSVRTVDVLHDPRPPRDEIVPVETRR